MAQQQNVTISAPGAQGLNSEDSPLEQNPGFCAEATNAVVDRLGRLGSRDAFSSFAPAPSLTYTVHGSAVSAVTALHRIGNGDIGGVNTTLVTASVIQKDASGIQVQADYFICSLSGATLTELTLPSVSVPAALADAKIVSFNDRLYVFSEGNEAMEFDGTSLSLLFTGVADTDYIAPQDDTGVIASSINGDVACAAYGRLWVSGVGGDYNTVHYSDLLVATQWYDGRASPADSQNTGGFIAVDEFWPSGSDRVVAIVAHNNALFIMGRQSILVYNNAASGDPAAADGLFLADTVTNIGCVSRDAVANIGSDVLFLDDSGVRSLGRTIQEKSAPLGNLTANIQREITEDIRQVSDKSTLALSYWPEDNLTVAIFPETDSAFVLNMRAPSLSGGYKVTRWTKCVWERALYIESGGTARVLLTSSVTNSISSIAVPVIVGDALLEYSDGANHDGEPFEFAYESQPLTFGQPANLKLIKQIDYTVVSAQSDTTAVAEWAYRGGRDYSKNLTIPAAVPALYGVAEYGTALYGPGLATTRRYRVNAKGSGETVSIGFRADVNGNACSLQEINVQTLLGRTL